MKREEIIAKVLKKLAQNEKIIRIFIENLKKIYQRNKKKSFEDQTLPREILKFIGDFMDEFPLKEKDKLLLLKEAKKNKLFDFTLNKNLERAWRTILKKWNLRHYRLEGGL